MSRWRTRGLLFAAVLVGGLLAGTTVDRAVVATAAWRHLGPQAWAAYSTHADLGPGTIVYPLAGIGSAVLAVAAAVSYRFDHAAARAGAVPSYLSALLWVTVIATTVKAAPIMDSVAHLTEPAALKHAFDQFTLWGLDIRGGLAFLGFASGLWALTTVRTDNPRPDVVAGKVEEASS